MKLKALVAVMALASLGQVAHAKINTNTTGTVKNAAELFLSVYDNGRSYTKDLGITVAQFEAGASTAGTHTFATLTGDSNWTTFLGAANLATAKWTVIGENVIGDIASANDIKFLSTIKAGTESSALGQDTVDQVNSVASNTTGFIDSVNTTGSHPGGVSVNGSSVNLAGTPAYFGPYANQLSYISGNAIGTASSFIKEASLDWADPTSVQDPTQDLAVLTTYAGKLNLASTAGAYSLTYTVAGTVSGVPEPEGYAMALAGLAALGFMARRRAA